MHAAAPVPFAERIEILDVLRGLAVGGILIGNMQWFSGYGMMPPVLEDQAPLADQITHFLVHFLVEGKFYSIFSFLFGFGFALQIARAEERGDPKATLFKRRLFWLLVIGLLHAYLLWAGDILSVYAVTGFVLLLFRMVSDVGLLKWAFALMAVPIVTYCLLFVAFVNFAPSDVAANIDRAQLDSWNNALQTVPNSSYFEIITGYNLNYVVGRYMGLIFGMRLPKILAMFLLGYYAYRAGIFRDPTDYHGFLRKVLIYGLSFGLIANFVFAVFAGNESPFPPSAEGIIGVAAYAFGVPALALGYVALVTTLWQQDTGRSVLSYLAPAGRMALTNYLLQTVVCVFLFYGYGLGLFGKFGATVSTLVAIGIFLLQIPLSALWLRHYAYGPMEWIWRQLTYRKRLNLRLQE
jgi:uncharacterized protein